MEFAQFSWSTMTKTYWIIIVFLAFSSTLYTDSPWHSLAHRGTRETDINIRRQIKSRLKLRITCCPCPAAPSQLSVVQSIKRPPHFWGMTQVELCRPLSLNNIYIHVVTRAMERVWLLVFIMTPVLNSVWKSVWGCYQSSCQQTNLENACLEDGTNLPPEPAWRHFP